MICHKAFVLVLFSISLRCTSQQEVEAKDELFNLTIVHINDFHSRYSGEREVSQLFSDGRVIIPTIGYARMVHTIKRLLNDNKNAIFVNSGDNYGDKDWYNIGRWKITSDLLNKMPADAMTLGPNEFYHAVEGLIPFLNELENTTVLVANMDSSREPKLKRLYQKSMIIERSNRKIGIVGVTTVEQNKIGNIGKLRFLDAGTAVEEEVEYLKCRGADIVVVLSHCGFDADKLLAVTHGSKIDVIVSSFIKPLQQDLEDELQHRFHRRFHPRFSHRYLPRRKIATPNGVYPTVVNHTSGNRVLIVQAGENGEFVGELRVSFDNDGNIVNFGGAPIRIHSEIPQDSEVAAALRTWEQTINKDGAVSVGEMKWKMESYSCDYEECTFGNFLCDAMVDAYLDLNSTKSDSLNKIPIGLINYNIIPDMDIYQGGIPYSKIANWFPYKNILTAFEIPGKRLLEAIELSTIHLHTNVRGSPGFLSVAGLKVTYDMQKPELERVNEILVRCGNFSSPNYKPLSENSTYLAVVPNTLLYGTDGYDTLRKNSSNEQSFLDLSGALMRYIKKKSPIIRPVLEDRIKIHNSVWHRKPDVKKPEMFN